MKVLIIDDQKLFADTLRKVLTINPDIDYEVESAQSAEEGIPLVSRFKPNVVLLDIHMPGMDGIEAARVIHRNHPEVRIIMLTAFGYDEYVRKAMNHGAQGYILKDITSDELIGTIEAVNRGVKIVSPEILTNKTHEPSAEEKPVPEWYGFLSNRERDVLVEVMGGYSNEEIASRVNLSLQTVKNYLSSIYDKMDVDNRFQAMRAAMEYRIDRLPPPH